MRNLAKLAILGVLVVLQSGCAAGVMVTRPRLPTIVIGEVPEEPAHRPTPPPPPRRKPEPRMISRGQAIALGQQWCHANGYPCSLDEAELKRGKGIWKVEFDTIYRERRGRKREGEVRLEIDAFSGRILHVDVRRG